MSRETFIHILPLHRLLLPLLFVLISVSGVIGDEEKKFYIAFLGDHPVNADSTLELHVNLLSSVKESPLDAAESMVYSYSKSFNAFAAKLSQDEANQLSGMDEVLAVIPNQYHKLHTTKSWDFLGLPQTAKRRLKTESDMIVALFDTGITPHADSFKDEGFGRPPSKWKGTCGRFANFSGCNNKIIGARYFKLDGTPDPQDILSPVDVDGHGTHTSSTLAGNLVKNASLFGIAQGTARGAVPSARVAMYKVCWVSFGCSDMDILAAFDAAIKDGVDIISISIGGISPNYTSDSIAVGAFHAMSKGILTVASGGNDGPNLGSVSNHAPWILTAAASGIDRDFRSTVRLGNGIKNISGIGVSAFNPKQELYPLVNGADAARNSESKDFARFCMQDSLDPAKVKGKLVYCKLGTGGTDSIVRGIGGVGLIVESDEFLDAAEIFMAPGTVVNGITGGLIENYIHSTRSPSAVIYRTQETRRAPAPFVASFSSRGPSPGTQRLLKPDIVAPGVNILAAYTPIKSITGLKGDTQYSKFTIMSGTSMSCPHTAGVAAYVKSFHPNWSPAAIKSAILTTATPMSRRVNKDSEFAFGAGQVSPTRAVNPGLVYDMDELAYIQFLCHEGYKDSTLVVLVGSKSINCSTLLPGRGYDALNYPTMQFSLENSQEPTTGVFRRTVTNVGPAISIYNATINAPRGVEITVRPTSLSFSRVLQKRSFTVIVKAKPMPILQMVSGSLVWGSSRHIVRSPIVVYRPDAEGS
ncbi:Xylem serine proteinase 1 [Morella rubra]|uniref:Xylem serine proteinase 1 n=1 Tax=Morella rubra TaxID=262757 RepID=A0A6A1UKS6_9ROSI|nr:Xylem serine proteinase 1 [Morella rubra]